MKYANFVKKTELILIRTITSVFSVAVVIDIYIHLFVQSNKQRDIVTLVYCFFVWGICIFFIICLAKFQRTFRIDDDGIIEQVLFKNTITKWSEYSVWEVLRFHRRKYICAYKTKEIPALKRYFGIYNPKTFPMTFIRYTEEIYREFTEYAEKNHIPELREK